MSYEQDLADAEASGLPFRRVFDVKNGPSIAYLTPEEIAAAQAATAAETAAQNTPEALATASIKAAVASDTTLAALKAMDNTEFEAWWAANVTNAAQAINVLKRLAKIVVRRL